MTRESYLMELRARLSGRMSAQELENVMAYYTEYFDEAGPDREGVVMEELGSPDRLSRMVMGDKVLEELEQAPQGRQTPPPGQQQPWGEPSEKPKRRSLGTLWTVLLAICAAPIAIPVIIAVVAVVVVLVVAIFGVVIGVAAGGIACIAAGIFSIGCGFSAIFSSGITTTMFFSGIGLLSSGIGLLLIAGVIALAKVCFKGLARLIGRLLHRKGARA